MNCLWINTAGRGSVVAVGRPGQNPVVEHKSDAKGQDGTLPGQVEQVLSKAGLAFADLSRIAVCVGPGSFTGTRIGVSFARGLALALRIRCVGVTSLMTDLPLGATGLSIVLRPAQVRLPDLTWWGQVFHDRDIRSQPFEIGMKGIEASFSGFSGSVVVGDDAPLASLFPDARMRPACPEQDTSSVFDWAERLSPDLCPPVPAYVRPPDAKPQARP